jgi:hypothetical protein
MECPECHKEMEQLCMYGNDEEINIDWHCEHCQCCATLKWTPKKRTVAEFLENDVNEF